MRLPGFGDGGGALMRPRRSRAASRQLTECRGRYVCYSRWADAI